MKSHLLVYHLAVLYAFNLALQYEFKPGGERLVFDLRKLGVDDVPLLGRYEYRSVCPALKTHTHPGVLEICYLARGRQTYRAGGRKYHLAGGDVFVTAPGEPHDTAGQPEDCGILYWVNLRIPPSGECLLRLSKRDSAVLVRKLLTLPKRKFSGSPAMKSILDQVFASIARPEDPLGRVAIINHMVRFLLEVLDCAQGHARAGMSPEIRAAAEQIHAHPEENYPLEPLAAAAGLSLSRFKTRFRMEVGIGPHEYILREKIAVARRLLEQDGSVTEVAMQLGFSSSQYFATVFRRFTRKSPREFRSTGAAVPVRPA